jgi:hypothetical protein
MATISNTPRPGYVWDSTDNVWYPIGTGPHTHADYITSSSAINPNIVDAKGDIIAATAADTVARLAVGANDTVLTADSSTATGLKWATPAAGGMTLISTTTLTGASVTLSSIPSTYNHLQFVVRNFKPATDDEQLCLRFNGDSGSNRYIFTDANALATNPFNNTKIELDIGVDNSVDENLYVYTIPDYANSTTRKFVEGISVANDNATTANINYVYNKGFYNQLTAISSLVIFTATGGNFTSGTVYLYGVK